MSAAIETAVVPATEPVPAGILLAAVTAVVVGAGVVLFARRDLQ